MALLDHRGLPLRTQDLREPKATPAMIRMRSPFSPYIGEISPEWLASTLRLTEQGQYPERYLALAEEMEERDLHYRSVLATRKMALAAREIMVEPASALRQDRKIAALVREVLGADQFADVVADLQDALGKGFSVCEILWDVSGAEWRPGRIVHRDPRWFGFPPDDPYWPCRLDSGHLLPLEVYKFIVHLPRLKSGLPLRGGLARCAAWSFIAKNYTLKDWLAFSEVYGMPLRVGKYPLGTDEMDISVLLEAVAGLGSDAAAVIPESMVIEISESKSAGGNASLYKELAEFLDKQMSKGVLGQTETADATPGKLGATEEKAEVRMDILRFDARQNAVTLRRDLVEPLVRLNFGPEAALPLIRYDLPEPEDLDLLIQGVRTFVPMGLSVDADWLRAKFGMPAPEGDVPVLAAPGVRPAPETVAQSRRGAICPHCRSAQAQEEEPPQTPLVRGGKTPHPPAPLIGGEEPNAAIPAAYAGQMQERAADPLRGMLEAIRAEAEAAESLEALRDRLLSMYGNLDAEGLREVMAAGFALANLAGRYRVTEETES
jgi:phage gp29-like protein